MACEGMHVVAGTLGYMRSGGNPVGNMDQQKEVFVHMIQAYCVACRCTKGIGTECNPQPKQAKKLRTGMGRTSICLKMSLGMRWKGVYLRVCLAVYIFFFLKTQISDTSLC